MIFDNYPSLGSNYTPNLLFSKRIKVFLMDDKKNEIDPKYKELITKILNTPTTIIYNILGTFNQKKCEIYANEFIGADLNTMTITLVYSSLNEQVSSGFAHVVYNKQYGKFIIDLEDPLTTDQLIILNVSANIKNSNVSISYNINNKLL